MSKPRWTPEQQSAITARGSNLLVAAAAGAGKTAVLVERIIRHLTEPDAQGLMLDVDKLLVVTFTNAASSEMRQRISDALAQKLNEAPNAHINRQLALIGNASITTLHSFCLEIVRRYFYKIDIDPTFRIANENEIALLKQEVIENVFEEYYSMEDDNTGFLQLVDAYGGERGDEILAEIVLKLQNFSRSMPYPVKWLRDMAEVYKIDATEGLNSLPWIEELLKTLKLQFQGAQEKLRKALEISKKPCGPNGYTANFLKDIQIIEAFISAPSWEKLALEMATFEKFDSLKAMRKNDELDEDLKLQAHKLREDAKDTIIKNIKLKYFTKSTAEQVADLAMLHPSIEALVGLTLKFDDAFAKAKQEKSIVDFNDLEHFCLKILLESVDAAAALREHYAEVLVDEYQDINPLQELILNLVSRQGTDHQNLFMVGDVKQSIYRFRLTEPELFLGKYRTYPTLQGGNELRIDLAANFRSRKSILDSVNFIFRQIMTKDVGEMHYDKQAELVGGADYPPAENTPSSVVEVHIINRMSDNNQVDEDEEGPSFIAEQEELDASKLEARLLAQRIKAMIGEFVVFDKQEGAYRPVTYRDIVILLRATKGWANTFLEEFRTAGIPAYAELGSGYFEATEVETMLSLLQVIDNPRQDIHLAGVLRSPFVGLTASELSQIRMADMKGDFYDAVTAEAKVNENDAIENFKLKLTLNAFLDKLEGWRTAARQAPLSMLIWQIYRETGYYDYVGGMPAGSQRQANLRALYDRALEYEATSLRGLFRFLRFIERVRDKGNDLGAARSLGENENVVRIMSVHKSKGLEFPVVILAGMGKGFNFMDINNKFLLHKKMGIGIDAINLSLRVTYPTLLKKAMQQKMRLETLAEEMRLLYVAMTRAREKLILCGTVKDLTKEAEKWAACLDTQEWCLPDYELSKAKSYLNWLGSALIRRDASHVKLEISNDPSRWEIFYHGRTDIVAFEQQQEVTDEVLIKVKALQHVDISGEDSSKVKAWLSWKYPYRLAATKPAKSSVTEMKRLFDPFIIEEEVSNSTRKGSFERPKFMQQRKGLTASERGSAMHIAMQHVDICLGIDVESLAKQIEELIAKQIINQEQAKAIDIERIAEFFVTQLGQRMLHAKSVKKELPFTLALPAATAQDRVIVQGVIDCLFEDEAGLVLLDYKTDRIAEGDEQELVNRYIGQLGLYAHAIETILKKEVTEKWIYMFHTGKCVKL